MHGTINTEWTCISRSHLPSGGEENWAHCSLYVAQCSQMAHSIAVYFMVVNESHWDMIVHINSVHCTSRRKHSAFQKRKVSGSSFAGVPKPILRTLSLGKGTECMGLLKEPEVEMQVSQSGADWVGRMGTRHNITTVTLRPISPFQFPNLMCIWGHWYRLHPFSRLWCVMYTTMVSMGTHALQ